LAESSAELHFGLVASRQAGQGTPFESHSFHRRFPLRRYVAAAVVTGTAAFVG
jgi:hypothetical protein